MTVDTKALRYLLDPYVDWSGAQGIPVIEATGVDLLGVETAPWPRLGKGVRAAFVHLAGRGDFVGLQVIDLPPGARTDFARHQFDEVFFVLSGHGSTRVETAAGETVGFDWRRQALFSPPLNAPYRLINGSGSEPARLVCASNLPFAMNFFRNERFLFDNPFAFSNRAGPSRHFEGEGDFRALAPGQHMWETNFVPNLAALELQAREARGTGSRDIKIILADSAMHVQVSEMPVGGYKKAHRHGAGAHVFALAGSGYTLLWREGDAEFERQDWRLGYVFAPPDGMFHQHFNTGRVPARQLAVSLGSHRYPVFARALERKAAADGGAQIDYGDQDPRIHRLWLSALATEGIRSNEDRALDADAIRGERTE